MLDPGLQQAAPLRKNPLICKRLVPAVNAVEHDCYSNAYDGDVRESPILFENEHGDSAAFSLLPTNGVSAMADSVSPLAEEAEIQTVTDGAAEARREFRRVAAARRNDRMRNPCDAAAQVTSDVGSDAGSD